MADLVNLQQSEYDTVMTQLEELHEAVLEKLKAISREIRALSQTEGGFYIEQISDKIDLLLGALETDILSLAETNFTSSVTAMSDFADIILNVDTACS